MLLEKTLNITRTDTATEKEKKKRPAAVIPNHSYEEFKATKLDSMLK